MMHSYLGKSPQYDDTNFVAPSADLIGSVSLGTDSSVWYNCTLRGDINFIEIGSSTNIQDNSVVHVADDLPVKIGSHVSVGHNCTVHACSIADNVLIGIGSVIMDGAEIESDSIVGAGTLISKNKKYPGGSLLVGSPARVLRRLTPEEIQYILHLSQKYVKVKNNYLQGA